LIKLAIIIPFFNEELRIGEGKYLKELSSKLDADFFYVNDGSTDNTKSKLEELSHTTRARIVNLAVNSGKGEAIRAGLLQATKIGNYDAVGYLDADGAFPVSEVVRSLELAKSTFLSMPKIEIFIASRIKLAGKDINRSPVRHYLSRLIITLIGLRTKNMPYDSQSGLKFFRTSDALTEAINDSFTRWFFDLELMSRLGMQKRDCTWEEPVNSWSDIKGSKIGLSSIFSIAKELLAVIRILSRD
jgi:glycosyltransferase involved in cell wall biosynthesis